MRIEIRARRLRLDAEVREFITRRLQFALGRFSPKISHVTVTLEDVNGPRGGPDKRCSLKLVLESGGDPLLAEDTSSDLHVAVDAAAQKLSRAMGRLVNRLARPRARSRASSREGAQS